MYDRNQWRLIAAGHLSLATLHAPFTIHHPPRTIHHLCPVPLCQEGSCSGNSQAIALNPQAKAADPQAKPADPQAKPADPQAKPARSRRFCPIPKDLRERRRKKLTCQDRCWPTQRAGWPEATGNQIQSSKCKFQEGLPSRESILHFAFCILNSAGLPYHHGGRTNCGPSWSFCFLARSARRRMRGSSRV